MMTTKATLDLLEERISRLEELLKGPSVEYVTETDAEGNEIVVARSIASEECSKRTVVERIADLRQALDRRIANRRPVQDAFSKIKLLSQYTDPLYASRVSASTEAKLQLVQVNEAKLCKMARQLRLIEQLKPVLDSEHIRSAPNQLGQLSASGAHAAEVQQELAEISAEVSALVAQHNEQVLLINKQLLYWDSLIKEKERKA